MSDQGARAGRYTDGKTHQSVELKLPRLLIGAIDVTSTFGEVPRVDLVLASPPDPAELEELQGYLDAGTTIAWKLGSPR